MGEADVQVSASPTPEIRHEEEITVLKARLAELENERQPAQMLLTQYPVEVTVAMSTYNCWKALPRSLWSLERGSQSLPMQLMLCDNGSTDPTADIVASPRLRTWLQKECQFPKVTVLGPTPQTTHDLVDGSALQGQDRKSANMEFQRAKLAMYCDTPFIWYVDADVVVPPGAAQVLLKALKADPKLAVIGLLYDWNVDHVQFGCAMCRADIMKEVKWRSEGCECRYVTRLLRDVGYKVEYLPPEKMVARHLKWELEGA